MLAHCGSCKFRKDTGAQVVPPSQWVILHLVRGKGIGQMVLVEEGGRWGVQQSVRMSNRLVWAVAVLKIN